MGKVSETIGEKDSTEKAQEIAGPSAKLSGLTITTTSAVKETRYELTSKTTTAITTSADAGC